MSEVFKNAELRYLAATYRNLADTYIAFYCWHQIFFAKTKGYANPKIQMLPDIGATTCRFSRICEPATPCLRGIFYSAYLHLP